MLRKGEKGLSTIVATLLIILLTLVAVGIIWIVVRNVIQNGAEQISLGKFTLDLEISQVQRINDSAMIVTVKRNVGEGEFVGISFVVEEYKNTEIIKKNVSMKQLETQSFLLYFNKVNSSKVKKISIAPIFRLKSGKEIVGDVKDEFKVSSIGVNGFFEEEEGCGNGICDNAETCSNCSADCGICLTCGDGICNNGETCANCSADCGACGEMRYLVQNGVGLSDIVVSSTAPNMVKLAAKYFQMYIYNMTGVNLTLSNSPNQNFDFHVYIGQSSYTDALGINSVGCIYDGFKMVSGENYLVLLGDDEPFNLSNPRPGPPENKDTATLYAEWNALTYPDTWENDYIQYYMRDYMSLYMVFEEDGRGSMNAVHTFLYDQGIRWYAPGPIGKIIPIKEDIYFQDVNITKNADFPLRYFFFYSKVFSLLDPWNYNINEVEDEFQWQMSLRINNVHEFIVPYAHGMGGVLGRDETKLAHPEYYAIWDGMRMNEDNYKPDLCSQELFEENVRFVKKMFDIYDPPILNVMPSDGFDKTSESSPACKARETPERGYEGTISDYVWEYVNNVAWEIYNDPKYVNKNISCGAYTAYLLPPEHLSKPVAPNLVVDIARWRSAFKDEKTKEFYKNISNQWLALLPSKQIRTYDYYLHNQIGRSTQNIPTYFPHIISEDLKYLKSKSFGEGIEVDTKPSFRSTLFNDSWDIFAATSFNVYVTARLYWDADQDVDTLLEEYYTLYYGPVSQQMKTFVEYSEANYDSGDPMVINTMRQMLVNARTATGNTVYGERIDLLIKLINSNFIGAEVSINSCQVLNSSTSTYKLTSDVSSVDTCFTFDADGVTLDCQGHTITYSTSGGTNQYGILISEYGTGKGDYFNIKNCVIQDGNYLSANPNREGIYLYYADKGIIENTNINSSATGIMITNSYENVFKENNIRSNTGITIYIQGSDDLSNEFRNNIFMSDSNYALFVYTNNTILINNNFSSKSSSSIWVASSSYNNTFINNIFTSDSGYGIQIDGKKNNFISNRIISNLNNGLAIFSGSENIFNSNVIFSNSKEAIYIEGPNNTFISNTAISTSRAGVLIQNPNNNFINQTAIGATYGIAIYGAANTFVKDCFNIAGGTYDVYLHYYPGAVNNNFVNCSYNSEYVSSGSGEILRKWYLDYYVTGAPGIGANVSSRNSLGLLDKTSLTDSSGRTRQELTEYINTGTKLYRTPHTVTTMKSGYNTDTKIYNLTSLKNVVATITLS